MADTKLSIHQLPLDSTPTADSPKPVASGGVKTYVDTVVAGLQLPEHYKGQLDYVFNHAPDVNDVTPDGDALGLVTATNQLVSFTTANGWVNGDVLTPLVGDYYYVLHLAGTPNSPEGSITWNGEWWDVAPDHYHQPDNTTIDLNEDARLQIAPEVQATIAGKVDQIVYGSEAVNQFAVGMITEIDNTESSWTTAKIALQSTTYSEGEYNSTVLLNASSHNYYVTAVLNARDGSPTFSFTDPGDQGTLVQGVADPVNDHDAATKGYVDTAISTAVSAAVPEILQYDLTNQMDGEKTVFTIDSGITASSFVMVHYAGQMLVEGVNYTIDTTTHTLTYLGTPPDADDSRHLTLLVINLTPQSQPPEILHS
jgi:hypothetical protein